MLGFFYDNQNTFTQYMYRFEFLVYFFLYFLDLDPCQSRIFFQHLLTVGGCWYSNIHLNIKKVSPCKKTGTWLDLKLSRPHCRGSHKYYLHWSLSTHNITHHQLKKKIHVFIHISVYLLVYILFNQVCLSNLLPENIGFSEHSVLLYVNLVLSEHVSRVVEEHVSPVQEQDHVPWILVGHVIAAATSKPTGEGIIQKNYFG